MNSDERRQGDSIRHKVPEGMYTMKDVADRADVSRDTIKYWHEKGALPHTRIWEVGKLRVYLFDDAAVTLAQRLALSRTRLSRRVEETTYHLPNKP